GSAIHDTATLDVPAGTGGTITFKAFKRTGANPDCSAQNPDFTSQPITVNGPGDYGSGDFTPTNSGTYDWLVTYTGDASKLILGTTAPCGDQTGDNDETSDVTPRNPDLSTDAS